MKQKDWPRIYFNFIIGTVFLVGLIFVGYEYHISADYHQEQNNKKCNTINLDYVVDGDQSYCVDKEGRLYSVPGGYSKPSDLFVLSLAGLLILILWFYADVWSNFPRK